MPLSKNKRAVSISMSHDLYGRVAEYAKGAELPIARACVILITNQLRAIEESGEIVRVMRSLSDEELANIAKLGALKIKEEMNEKVAE